MKDFLKFALLVAMSYAFLMLIGAALTQQSVECLVLSGIMLAILLIVFPVFRKGENE